MNPIGKIYTPFKEKFGVPRQSLMLPKARGVIVLNSDPRFYDAIRCLKDFSHLWIIFKFEDLGRDWQPLVSPPRLDAPSRVGVFATRSPYRPNPIGMSVVELDYIEDNPKSEIKIHVRGVDLLDQTLILDIKPYVPYVDCVPQARGAFTETAIPKYEVEYSAQALECLRLQGEEDQLLIHQILELDPRPVSQKKMAPIEDSQSEGREFAFRIFNVDIKWKITHQKITVTKIIPLL